MPKKSRKTRVTSPSKTVTKVSVSTLLVPLTFLVIVFFSVIILYRALFSPPLVPGSTCADYCPGKLADYQVVVYENVENKFHCVLLGGRPYTMYGWEKQTICIAE